MPEHYKPFKYQRRLVAELAAILSYAHDQDIGPALWDQMDQQQQVTAGSLGVVMTTTSLQLLQEGAEHPCISIGTPPTYRREIASIADAVAEKLYVITMEYRKLHGSTDKFFDQYEIFRVCEVGLTQGQGVSVVFSPDGGVEIKAMGNTDQPTLTYADAKKVLQV